MVISMQIKTVNRYWGRKPIEVFSQFFKDSDSVIVDPFGGSGTIVKEALKRNKRAIYFDINPYAWLTAHVYIVGANPKEFSEAYNAILNESMKNDIKIKPLINDWLYYNNGQPFLKKRNFERVRDFFPKENLKKIMKILKSIDSFNASLNTKIALYLTLSNALFPSSKMNRKGAGSWGIPSYWVPSNNSPMDPFLAFENAAKRMTRFLKQEHFYNACYTLCCDKEVSLLLGNALKINYKPEWTLFTDPPFTDEVQYMELSYFYWTFLKNSNLPRLMSNLLGKRVIYDFRGELVVNPKRGTNINNYFYLLYKFINKASVAKRIVLIFHEENTQYVNIVKEMLKIHNKKYVEHSIAITNQRKIGPRGDIKYIVFES